MTFSVCLGAGTAASNWHVLKGPDGDHHRSVELTAQIFMGISPASACIMDSATAILGPSVTVELRGGVTERYLGA